MQRIQYRKVVTNHKDPAKELLEYYLRKETESLEVAEREITRKYTQLYLESTTYRGT